MDLMHAARIVYHKLKEKVKDGCICCYCKYTDKETLRKIAVLNV